MRDLFSGLFWLTISIFICIESIQATVGSFRSPGPGFLPLCSGIVLGIFTIALMITSMIGKRREGRIKPLWKGVEWNKVVLVLISLFIYGILLPSLGYLITTFGLMFFLFGRIGKTRLWIQAVIASLTSMVTYIIFHVWLEVLLPKGIFGF